MKEITPTALKALIDKEENIQLIDVRETEEHQSVSIGGINIPVGDIPNRFQEIDSTITTVIYCRSGKRGGNVTQYLEKEKGFNNLQNLQGGLLQWVEEVDPQFPIH